MDSRKWHNEACWPLRRSSFPAAGGRGGGTEGGAASSVRENRGSFILLSFCSCYTDSCCAIVDALEELKSSYAAEGLVTLVVCSEIAPTLEKDGYAGILGQCAEAADMVLIDEGKRAKGRFKIRRLPTTFLLNASFCARYKVTTAGALYTKTFRDLLETVLKEKPGTE
jgi:hypothetical protein